MWSIKFHREIVMATHLLLQIWYVPQYGITSALGVVSVQSGQTTGIFGIGGSQSHVCITAYI